MILFAKAPVPGAVKTRLAAAIGASRAAELHTAFVADMLEKLNAFKDFSDIELHTDIPTDAWNKLPVTRRLQAPGNLELKLFHALAEAFGEDRTHVIILGSDSPTLPRAHIQRLLDATADVAIGPCEDGGYYAIGCRRAHPDMFAGVEWSTGRVLEQTESALEMCGLSCERGEIWYDVDGPVDLARLMAEPELPGYTRQAIGL
jgi:uncharacterized protein